MPSPDDPKRGDRIAKASQATTKPGTLAEREQSTEASAIGAAIAAAEEEHAPRVGRYRWGICALLLLATTICYIDRLVFSILGPELQKTFGWTDKDYTDIVFWFEVAYAIGLLTAGRLLDRIGARIGYTISLVFWSLAAILHAFMSTIFGFSVARFLLGLGESGNFPAAVKTVAEWFPKKERALATGIFNAGSNVGAIIAPLGVPWIYLNYGWQWAFIFTGALGLLWIVFWLMFYRVPGEHPKLSPAELAYIQSDPPEPSEQIAWLKLIPDRQTWAFAIAKFMTDSIWRWYLYLLPLFFAQDFNLDISDFGPPFLVIYLLADVGSIAGGWLSGYLIQRGNTVNFGRKVTMLVCALLVYPSPSFRKCQTCGSPSYWSDSPRRRIRAGRLTFSLPLPICFPSRRSVPSSGSAAWPALWARCSS